jgi:hypothetical protein
MKLPTLTQLAKGYAYLDWYSDGVLRYHIRWTDENVDDPHLAKEKLEFQVDIPISDTGGGQFTPMMKGLNILRWARKQLESIQESMP